MKKLHIDIAKNETQTELSDRATSEANKLTDASKGCNMYTNTA